MHIISEKLKNHRNITSFESSNIFIFVGFLLLNTSYKGKQTHSSKNNVNTILGI